MKEKIICKSNNGDVIEIGSFFPFILDEIQGIHKVSGNVSTVKSAFGVGTKYVGTSVNDRDITIIGNMRNTQKNRDILYKSFPLNNNGTLFYYKDDLARKIDYQVVDIDVSDKYSHNAFQISLKCPSPYFTDIDETVVQLANWNKLLTFPLIIPDEQGIEFGSKSMSLLANIVNLSNIEIGMRIVFNATDEVVNPSITNVITKETLKLEQTLKNGDSIEVTTYINQKNIYITVDGERKRKNNALVFGSKFLQLHNGTNSFKFDADSGTKNLEVEFYYYNHYEAI